MPSALVTLITLILGLFIGLGLGIWISRTKNAAGSGTHLAQELNDLKVLLKASDDRLKAAEAKSENDTKIATQMEEMKASVERMRIQANDAAEKRVASEVQLIGTIDEMRKASTSFFDETKKIAGALANSQTRGKFGEAHLEKLLESAGLIENEHFTRQSASAKIGDSGAIPDVTINMPGGSVIYIDSKFPFQRFYEAFETEDDLIRKELLVEHSKDLLAHIQALSKRNYAERGPSPDFVILYAPIDAIFIEAVKAIPDFLETSFRLGVTIATPTSMMALLRSVGYLFSRNRVAANAEEIQSLAVKFLRDVSSLHEKIVTVGERLKSTLKAYNEMIPTAETTVLSAAKKMKALDVSGKPLKTLPEVSENLRILESKLALDAPEDFIEVEEVDEVDEDER